MATELIPAIDGEVDSFGDFPAAWEFARLARTSLDFTPITSATYTVLLADHIVLADATSNAITLTMPSAASMIGRVVRVKAISVAGGNITIDGAGAETIDGATTLVLSALNAKTALFSDGVKWLTI